MNRLSFMKNFKAYTLRIKDQRKQNISMLRSYLKKQRVIIMQNTRKKILRGFLWVSLISVSYYIGHKIYSQKLEVQQMQKKLTRLYPSVVKKIQSQGKNEIYYVTPEYDDQLANIIEMCWKYHYKVIVNSEPIESQTRNQKILEFLKQIPEAIKDKCLIINLEKLKKADFDEINGTMKVETGLTCKQLNEKLKTLGYEPIFSEEVAENLNQTVYNAVVNNYPTNNGPIANEIVNIDLISSQGQYFRSSNENNQYGATPNLNTIFVGTGGIFGLPIRTTFKTEVQISQKTTKNYIIQTADLNQKLLTTRKVKQILSGAQNLCKLSICNTNSNSVEIILTTNKAFEDQLKNIERKFELQLPDLKQRQNIIQPEERKKDFNIFFNINQRAFQKFLILRHKKKTADGTLSFNFSQNLLKVNCRVESMLMQLISELCSQNGVVVWCQDHRFMKQIKKFTDESEVGSELMKILVQIREGIDHKKIYYTHNRYEEYFAKGAFRKLTEVFW